MRLVRWWLLLPGAIFVSIIGSLAGGMVATPLGQSAINTSSTFFGTFALVCAVGIIAPSQRNKVMLVTVSLMSILALLSFVLSVFTTIEEFSDMPTREKALIPIAQLLGSLYALFILPPLATEGSTLEQLWREVMTLGVVVVIFGLLVALIGLIFGLLGSGWIGLSVGVGVLLLGVFTWLTPLAHINLRLSRAKAFKNSCYAPKEIGCKLTNSR